MNIVLVELEAMVTLGYTIIKSIFKSKTVYYVCPNCNIVLRKYTHSCKRCVTTIQWN